MRILIGIILFQAFFIITGAVAESDRVTTVVNAVVVKNEETNVPEVHIVDNKGNVMVATVGKARRACESLL